MRRLVAWIGLVAMGCACSPEEPAPIPDLDAGVRPRFPDGRVILRDGGPRRPAIDGVIDEGEWDGATRVEASVATDREGSELARLSAHVAHGRLWVAVEGTIADGDAIVVWVDADHGGTGGVAPSELADTDGALDAAITQTALDVDGFSMHAAWGTRQMPHDGRLDGALGWRDVASDPTAYAILAEGVDGACGEAACETSIPLDALGGSEPRTIALFARIVRGDGGLTNQTLPEDDPGRPAVVRALLTIDVEAPRPDAGPPDAGADAGVGGIVIDGVLDEPEWASAAVETNDVPAAGIFAGNALRTLRALRDETHLYVAIEATLTSGNAILMYVDRDLGGEDGLVLGTTELTDGSGALDRAFTKDFFTADLRLDAAWGTTRMPHAASDDAMGWRDIATNPASYRVLPGASACSAAACEASIALSELGTGPGETVAIAVRLGSAVNAAVSNQTLPEDLDPDTIATYAILPP
ncbi:MAG TPA: hypothetical protein VIL20_10785 [Sandaracinaceae bacterium]